MKYPGDLLHRRSQGFDRRWFGQPLPIGSVSAGIETREITGGLLGDPAPGAGEHSPVFFLKKTQDSQTLQKDLVLEDG